MVAGGAGRVGLRFGMKTGRDAKNGCTPGGGGGVTVPLTVLPSGGEKKLKKSRASRWRFGVLVGVHVLMIAHIVHWKVAGTTLTPVEPSESMYTIEAGKINAGFVFFCLALLATFIFGRVFCGWGCHVVALQDACTALMTRMGVRPKPWRTRLLVFVPTVVALYMFVWPTFKREALLPLMRWGKIDPPFWMSAPPPRPTFHAEFMTDDFWATFGPWYMAPPFLLVVGFVVVYLLGSKAFCTYGCPYGGFFAPLDKVALARIEVTDACNGCGHCTAACDSNVRVHQEVKEYGRVVDPGCMKCFDCVSVCPNGALKYTYGLPSMFAKNKAAVPAKRPEYDLTVGGELCVLVVGWVLFSGFRGMFDHIAMLMAIGMAMAAVFMLWKLVQVLTVQNVRVHSFQLRSRGKLTGTGVAFVVLTALYAGFGVWGAVRDVNMMIGEYHDTKIVVPEDLVLAPEYQPLPKYVEHADAAIAAYTRAGAFADGGFGWKHPAETPARMAWFYVVKKDLAKAEEWMRKAMEYPQASEDLAMSMTLVMALQGKGPDEIHAAAREIIAEHPRMYRMRFALAVKLMEGGKTEEAVALALAVVDDEEQVAPAQMYVEAAGILATAGRVPDGLRALQVGQGHYPKYVSLLVGEAQLRYAMRQIEEAVGAMRRAKELEPENAELLRSFAGLLRSGAQTMGKAEWDAEATALEGRAAEIEAKAGAAGGAGNR